MARGKEMQEPCFLGGIIDRRNLAPGDVADTLSKATVFE